MAHAEHSLRRNTAAQGAQVLIGYVLGFLSAPVILHGLGLRQFGIWALTGALAQYGALLDLGITRALMRFVALYDVEGDRRAIGETLATGVGVLVASGALLVGAAAVLAGPLARGVGGISEATMRTVLLASVVMLVLTMLTRVIAAYPIGLRRMVVPSVVLIAGSVLNFAFSVGTIAAGGGLAQYAMANAAASALALVLMVVFVARAEGRIPLARPSRARARALLRFSLRSQVLWVADLVNFQTDKIVIAFAVSVQAAGAYELANRVCAAARAVGVIVPSALLPTLTARLADMDGPDAASTYRRLTTRSVAVGFPALCLCAALGPVLLGAWLGTVPSDAVTVLTGLSLAYLANVSTGVATALVSARGHPEVPARAAIGTAVLNGVLTASLAPVFGLWGVLGGTFAALTLGALWLLSAVHRGSGLVREDYVAAVRGPLLRSVLPALPIAVLVRALDPAQRAWQAALCAACVAAYAAVYAIWASRRGDLPALRPAVSARAA